MSDIDTLLRVKDLLEKGWTQGQLAEDIEGDEVSVCSPRATHFCLLGAVRREAHEDYKRYENLLYQNLKQLLDKPLSEYAEGRSTLADWNDSSLRQKSDVIGLIDACIAHLSSTP